MNIFGKIANRLRQRRHYICALIGHKAAYRDAETWSLVYCARCGRTGLPGAMLKADRAWIEDVKAKQPELYAQAMKIAGGDDRIADRPRIAAALHTMFH